MQGWHYDDSFRWADCRKETAMISPCDQQKSVCVAYMPFICAIFVDGDDDDDRHITRYYVENADFHDWFLFIVICLLPSITTIVIIFHVIFFL